MKTFDSNGRVDSVSSRGNGHPPHIYANGFHYNEKGVMDRLRLGNGLWEGLTVNSRYQTTQITLGTSSDGSELLKLDYNYGSTDNSGSLDDLDLYRIRSNQKIFLAPKWLNAGAEGNALGR